MTREQRRTPKITLAEILAIVAAAGFSTIGLLHWHDTGTPTGLFVGVFFAAATAVNAWPPLRRLCATAPPLEVSVIGGVPIRPSHGRLMAVGVACTTIGTLLCAWAAGQFPLAGLIGAPLLIAGLAALIGTLWGRLPAGFLRFDPAGLTVGHARFRYCIDWQDIAAVDASEFAGQPVVLIRLAGSAQLAAQPATHGESLQRHCRRNLSRSGAPVMLFPASFGISALVLAGAIARYAREEGSRPELGRQALVEAES